MVAGCAALSRPARLPQASYLGAFPGRFGAGGEAGGTGSGGDGQRWGGLGPRRRAGAGGAIGRSGRGPSARSADFLSAISPLIFMALWAKTP